MENPARRNRGVAEASLDGVRVDAHAIPLVDDGAVHRLRVVMGEPASEATPATAAEGVHSSGNQRNR